MKGRIRLSALGLKNACSNPQMKNEDKMFTFYIGNRFFKLNHFSADFLFPKIAKIHINDSSVSSYVISNIDDNNYQELFNQDTINQIYKLSIGDEIEINQETGINLRIISIIFENNELNDLIDKILPFDSLNSYLPFIQKAHIFKCVPFNNDQIISQIATNFSSFKEEEMMILPKSTFYAIISHPDLKLESEDSLYLFIKKYIKAKQNENDEIDDISFYEQINFSSLSEALFLDFISNIGIDNISAELWKKLFPCFYPNIIKAQRSNELMSSKRYLYKCQKFLFNGDNKKAFNGIIDHLSKECNWNVHTKGIVNVTASSAYLKHGKPENAVDLLGIKNYFQSNDDKNAWLQIDFKNKKVHPTHYSIKSRHEGKPKGDNNLVNWNIEGSNSGNENDWKVLDQRLNVTCLDELCAQNTFDISVHLDPNETFRFLRIRQTGMDSEGLYWVTFSAIEYFGFLYTQ